jgi:hypothetical protein
MEFRSYWSFDEKNLRILTSFWNIDCISFYDIYCKLRCLWVTSRGRKVFHNFMMNATVFHFTYDRGDPRHTSWNACLNVLVLTTTFKCSLKAFLTSVALSSPSTVMAHTHAFCWARMMFFGSPPLEGSTWGTHSLWKPEHVDWEVPNNCGTSCVLRLVATWLYNQPLLL